MEGFENSRCDEIIRAMEMHKGSSEMLTKRLTEDDISDEQKIALRKMRDTHVNKLVDLQNELNTLEGKEAKVIKLDPQIENDIELGKTG